MSYHYKGRSPSPIWSYHLPLPLRATQRESRQMDPSTASRIYAQYLQDVCSRMLSGRSPTSSPPNLEPHEWDYERSEEEVTRLKSSGRLGESFDLRPNDIKEEVSKEFLHFVRNALPYLSPSFTSEEKTYCDLMYDCINNRLAELSRLPSNHEILECLCNPYPSSEM